MRIKYMFFVTLSVILLSSSLAFSATLEGTVASVRPGLLIVNVGGRNLQADIQMEHATELTYASDLESLKLGDWVNVSYWKKDGRMIAGSIFKEANGPGEF